MFLELKRGWTLANMHLAKWLFDCGVAGWHQQIHEFAMRRIQMAADLDYLPAQLLFGQLLKYRGLTVYNKIAGVGYLRKAAQQGSTDAMFVLAEALQDDNLVMSQAEPNEVLDLYTLAAQAGHVMAALRLSKIYKKGLLGNEHNSELAEYWSARFLQNAHASEKVNYE